MFQTQHQIGFIKRILIMSTQQITYTTGTPIYSAQSRKALRFTIETQTEENEIISLCHLSEKVVALETSEIATKMLRLNRVLFDKINATTKLLGGRLYRQEITRSKPRVNRAGNEVFDDYDYKEYEISKLFFDNNRLIKQARLRTNKYKQIDYNPDTLKDASGKNLMDYENLTEHDIKNGEKISEIEEIQLFQDSGVKTYIIKDFLKQKESLFQVAYRIEVDVSSDFKSYIELVLKQLDDAIKFLLLYSNTIDSPTNYDPTKMEFRRGFKDSILSQLGIREDIITVNLSNNRIKESEFGKAAIAFYNASLLLNPNVEKGIYSRLLKGLLPTHLTSPENVIFITTSFSALRERIDKEYNLKKVFRKSDNNSSKISSTRNSIDKFISQTTSKIDIERETLGYNLFSEKQTGMNKLSSQSYRNRFVSEQAKYYPRMDIADETNFMTPSEKSEFTRMDNMSSFITPANLVLGKKKITTSRGINNMSINDIREFRIAKAARANQKMSTNFPSGLSKAKLSKNIMSDFNITIAKPKTPILERKVDEEIDPLVDAKYYLGDNSFFVTSDPQFIFKNFKRLMRKEDQRILAIVSDVIPRRFLRPKGAIDSIKDLQFSNKKSKIRSIVTEKRISIADIPPQIKSMMTKSFQSNPNIDPLKNRESREMLEETQKNVFLVRALIGFETGEDGFTDLNRPIEVDMKDAQMGGKPMIAKAYNYEVPELGIVKDKFMPTIYNNLLYIRG
jgi:hypothetical protein